MKWGTLMVALVLIPITTHAAIRITEVAWMGTTESAYGEWIELHNDGAESVDLKGWKLATEGGNSSLFTLSKTINPHDHVVVERVTASQNPIPERSDEEGAFGGGGLSDKGEDLVLLDTNASVIDSLSYAAGWPAGDAKTNETMQRSGNKWVTADPTPGEQLVGENADDTDAQEKNGSTAEGVKSVDPNPIPNVSPNKPRVEFNFPKIVYRGVPYTFELQPVLEYGYRVEHGFFLWNMGDGTIIRAYDLIAPVYTYQYPGTYTLSFAYYKEPSDRTAIITATKGIQVFDAAVSVGIVDGRMQFKNTSDKQIDLSEWRVISKNGNALIPPMTILAPKASITIPQSVIGFPIDSPWRIETPGEIIIAQSKAAQSYKVKSGTGASPDEKNPIVDMTTKDDTVLKQVEQPLKEKSHTKTIVIGTAALFVMTLFVLLERTMASKE